MRKLLQIPRGAQRFSFRNVCFRSIRNPWGVETICGGSPTSRLSRPFSLWAEPWMRSPTNIHARFTKSNFYTKKIMPCATALKPLFKPLRTASNLEGTGSLHFLRRFLQSSRQALRTRAEFAQIIERINAGIVAVAPAELERIVAYRRYADALQSRRNTPVDYFAHSRKLLNAGSAHAVFT